MFKNLCALIWYVIIVCEFHQLHGEVVFVLLAITFALTLLPVLYYRKKIIQCNKVLANNFILEILPVTQISIT